MKVGDILIPNVTKVSSCGTIIFQRGYEYVVVDVVIDNSVLLVFIDSEWGEWVLDSLEIMEKFRHIPLRKRKIDNIIGSLK
jgi:hypothetical protein